MKNVYDVVIIGGGASGLFCLANISGSKKIAIIDSNAKLGKKILATGNGRCNLTNINMSSEFFNQNIDSFLGKFNQQDTINYFSSIGLETYHDEEGRVYPITNLAKSVVDILNNACLEKNVDVFTNKKFVSLIKEKEAFLISTDKQSLYAKNVVVAMGGNSSENICKTFDLPYEKCFPSLVSLKTSRKNHLRNIRLSNVKVTLKTEDKGYTQSGEILFREEGVSGICIFNLSSHLARQKRFCGELVVDLLPNFDIQKLVLNLKKRQTLFKDMNTFFDGLLDRNVGYEVLLQSGVTKNKKPALLSIVEIKDIAKVIKNLTFEIKGNLGNNQVVSGGVKLQALTQNLESKKIKNLYFIGETCDVDGECGGYNLQWAWTSGKIVGERL